MKVIFMGTPEFAVPALQAIFDSSHQIVQVYTNPPAKSGRGHKLNISPIHDLANKLHLPVATPSKLRTPEVIAELAALQADIIVVAAYGQILPQAVLDLCPYGCINIHPSLLPRWRGAAPLERTVLAGDSETGVCTMQMDAGLDTGDILLCKKIALSSSITSLELSENLSMIGAELIVETLDTYLQITPIRQSEEGITYAKKLSKEESIVDWNKTAHEIDCMIRGLNPWPGCFFWYNGELIKILEATISKESSTAAAGTVLDDQLLIKCGQDALRLFKLQRPGRNPLAASEFLRGTKIPAHTVIPAQAGIQSK